MSRKQEPGGMLIFKQGTVKIFEWSLPKKIQAGAEEVPEFFQARSGL
jgi:hypothetical protein